MDIDGICLSVIDDLIYQVEQQQQMCKQSTPNHNLSLDQDNLLQTPKPSYNLHEFNDLYPHYPITPGKC